MTGATLLALIAACFQVPQKNTAQQNRISASDVIMQASRPLRPNLPTSMSTPRCRCSRMTTTAPMKVSQTKK